MRWNLMTRKVYPNANNAAGASPSPTSSSDDPMVVLTVWKKSLLLNCDGFTVFDSRGNLVYRVDNYCRSSSSSDNNNNNEIFLMDASGNTLLTIRRKNLMGRLVTGNNSWLVFDREMADAPKFLVVRKYNASKRGGVLARVFAINNHHQRAPSYEVEGCYGQRRCTVYDDNRCRVAEINPKETNVKGVAFGNDVFRLLVRPDFDSALAMAIVILLDRF